MRICILLDVVGRCGKRKTKIGRRPISRVRIIRAACGNEQNVFFSRDNAHVLYDIDRLSRALPLHSNSSCYFRSLFRFFFFVFFCVFTARLFYEKRIDRFRKRFPAFFHDKTFLLQSYLNDTHKIIVEPHDSFFGA